MDQTRQHIDLSTGTEKSFGIVFAIVFLLIALYPLMIGESIHLWSLVVAFILIILSYFAPTILVTPNNLWFKLGLILGSIVAPVVMVLVYVVTVVPVGLIMRIIGKDILGLTLNRNSKSYWIKRQQPIGPMSDQF